MLDNIPRGTICIEDLEIGMSRSLTKVIEDYDIRLFADVSTDRNPVHLDEAYAQETIFGGRMAQDLKFLAPVFPGDEVIAEVTVATIDHGRRRVTLECVCRVGDKAVLKGEAKVLAPSKKFD